MEQTKWYLLLGERKRARDFSTPAGEEGGGGHEQSFDSKFLMLRLEIG